MKPHSTIKNVAAALLLTTLASPMARADSNAERLPLGSHCGLIDFADDLLSDHVVQSTDLGRLSSAALEGIADPARSSIILAARELTRDASIQTIASAVAALKDAGQDAVMMTVQVEKKLFRVVLHYPGDNAVGMVFPLNSSTPVAEIQDSDVVCRKSAISTFSGTVPAIAGNVVNQDPDGKISEKTLEGWNFAKLLQEDPRSPGRYPYLHAGFSDGLHELLGYSEPNSIKLLDLMEVGPDRLKVIYVHTPDKSWLYDHEFIRHCDVTQEKCLAKVVDARNKMATHNHSVVTKRVVGYTEGDEKFAILFSCRSGSLKDLVAGDNSWTVGDLKKRVSLSFSRLDASSGSQADDLIEELQGINYRIQVYRSGNLLRGSLFTNPIAAKLGSFTGFQDFPAKLRTAVTAHCKGTCRILDESSASGLFSIRVQDQ